MARVQRKYTNSTKPDPLVGKAFSTQLLPVGLAVVVAMMVLLLGACGQPGPLYLPNDPEAKDRASLPEALLPFPVGTPEAVSETPLE